MKALARLYKISIVIIFILNLSLAASIPDANDINCVIEQSQQIYHDFQKQSFMTRMQVEYKDKFFNGEDQKKLLILAQKTSTKLNQLIDEQEKLKQAIEDYSGQDWEQKFSQNGLYRKLINNISITRANKLRADFVKAIASDDYNKNMTFREILKAIESFSNHPAEIDLIKSKIYASLAKVDLTYFDKAKKGLSNIIIRSDVSQQTTVESSIEFYKLTYQNTEQRDSILNYNLPSSLANDLELILPVVLLQRKLDGNTFEKAVEKQPQIKLILGPLVLANLNDDAEFKKTTTFEAKLAALSAWQDGPEKYSKLLGTLSSNEKFKTPVVLYVAAISCAENRPRRSAKLLIDASKRQKIDFDKILNIAPATIASQGCLLAYKTFAKDKDNEELTILTFENYFQLAGNDIDSRIEYLYCDVLNSLGQKEKSRELLKKISDDPASPYRYQSKYDLILEDLQRGLKTGLLEKVEELIYDSRQANQLEIESQAIKIYCHLALDSLDTDKAQKALSILKDTQLNLDDEIFAFKAKAYLLTGCFIESAKTMLELENNCLYFNQALDIFERAAADLDKMQYKQKELTELEENCRKVFGAFDSCLDKSQKTITELYLIEISIFVKQDDAVILEEIKKKLNSIAMADDNEFELLRCQARLMMCQHKFAQAGELWGKFCDLSKDMTKVPIEKNRSWWQGKYYQLYCFKNSPNAQKSELLHIIEVLERAYPDRDQFWALKISALK